MKRYEKYKPSGVDWIDEVPEHWEVTKLRKLGTFSASGIDKKIVEGEPLVQIINYVDVYRNSTKELREGEYMIVSAPAEKIKEHQVCVGDMIFLPSSETYEDLGLSAVVMDQLDNTAFSYHVLRFTCSSGIDINYRKYITNNNFCLSYFSSCGSGTIRKILSREIFKSCPVFLPPIDEQKTMAAFLDARCADIDKVVATQEKRIALLKEMKQSIITQAVTRGLNPDAKIKDSGVEWIGMVPEHWDVMPFKSKFKTDKGLSITKADLVDEGVPVISYGQIHSKQNDYVHTLDHLLRFIPEELIPTDSKAKLEIGDVVFADTSEDVEGSGNAFYIEREGVYAGYHTVIAKSIERVDNRYFAYLFATPIWRSQVRSQVYGVKVYSITQQILKATSLIVPPPEEQKQIVEVLEEKCARIDRQIDNIQNEIELLREYKQSLITDVVTGKVKVC